MKIIYTCPKCGHDLVDVSLCSYPAKNAMYCMSCGFMSEPGSEEIVRIPYGGNHYYDHVINASNGELSRLNSSGNAFVNSSFELNFSNSACVNCSNNPKNGGSGICFCTLGGPKITY